MLQFDVLFFQMGWFNHQLVTLQMGVFSVLEFMNFRHSAVFKLLPLACQRISWSLPFNAWGPVSFKGIIVFRSHYHSQKVIGSLGKCKLFFSGCPKPLALFVDLSKHLLMTWLEIDLHTKGSMIGIIKWTTMSKTLKGNILFHSIIVPNLWWQQVVFFHCSWDIVSKSVIQIQLTLLTFVSCPLDEVLFFSWRDLVLLTQLFTFLCGCSLKDRHRQKGGREQLLMAERSCMTWMLFRPFWKMGKDKPQHGPRTDRCKWGYNYNYNPFKWLEIKWESVFFLFSPLYVELWAPNL